MKLFIGGTATATLAFAFLLLHAKSGETFTLKDAGICLAAGLIPGILVGLAVWGLH